ncbi:hypothetical protein ACTOB_005366 [Actinoplanes oblitus]|uniref:Secreted protein n=1 Tax=Actinoplanes oblitus TaxID=3040509 RepID=A0ABY8WAG7_9ACTN|nr:hypothetical protein [Actinoplanes oblitus]WIM93389.1 hypothetical protein ACTOB_005366 [Actinoplanes oblitus]
MNVRTPLVVAAVAAAALAGCSSTESGGSAAPAGTASAAGAASTAPSPLASSPPAGGTAVGSSAAPVHSTRTAAAPVHSTRTATAKPAAGGCPPSEATLLKALRSSKVGDALAPTDTLTDITCYQGYALGQTHPKQADDAEVVFHYTGGAWHAVNGGTSDYCDGVVPAAVRPHLEHC